MVVADYDLARAEAHRGRGRRRAATGGDRFVAAQVDASTAAAVAALAREHAATHVFNAVDPRFVMPIFRGALAAGADYLDMAMSLSQRHPERALRAGAASSSATSSSRWQGSGRPTAGSPCVGIGVEPGLSDVFARYAADHLFSEIDELGTRDGANLAVHDDDGNEIFAPELLDVDDHRGVPQPARGLGEGTRGAGGDVEAGFFTLPAFSEPEVFDFPEGIGPVECVNVEHEEVLLMPRWVDAKRVTFKYGLGDEFITILQDPAHARASTAPTRSRVKGVQVSPRDVVAAVPARPGDHRPADEGQDLRRPLGHGHRQGRPAAPHVPLPRRRQRGDDARVRRAVRGVADRGQPRGRPRAARQRAPGRAPA